MIDLRAGLGAPPVVFPGVRLQRQPLPHPAAPAPMPPGQIAQRNLGCVGCTGATAAPVALAGVGVGDLQTWWDKIPLWAKITGGLVAFAGISYGVYRLVR